MKIGTRFTTTHVQVYEAFDGKQFNTEEECVEYENKANKELQARNKAEMLIVLRDYIPPGTTDIDDNSYIAWYKLENEDEFELLYAAFDEIDEPKEYPALICVESGYGWYNGYDLACSIRYVKELFGKLGFDVSIELKKEG
jgi:hypothetical protein